VTSLVITADDFGLAREVNEAVEIAHTRGILTAASLMVGASAAGDAIARARRLPTLKVGLHLVLVEGRPVLPAAQIPDLVDADGNFRDDMTRTGIAIFLRPSVQRQVAAEITAQFEMFATSGLVLDHVNAHKHFHLHPTIARLAIEIGRRYGMHTVRVPDEPTALLRRLDTTTPVAARLWPYTMLLRRRLHRSGIDCADHVFGCSWSGAMTPDRLERLIGALPAGRNEIYVHPATANRFAGSCDGYAYTNELDALLASGTIDAVREDRARRVVLASRSIA
jgi:hopanoid biosynthesis associated protein HpnK